MPNLSDNFNAVTLDTAKWPTSVGSPASVGNAINRRLWLPVIVNPPTEVASAIGYSLAGSSVQVALTAVPTGVTNIAFLAQQNASNYVGFRLVGPDLSLRSYTADVASETIIAHDLLAHRFLRIRESAGTVFWDTSNDGARWTTQRSLASPAWLAAATVQFRLYCGYVSGTTPTPTGQAEFDDVAHVSSQTYQQLVLSRASLVGLWPLNETTGTVAADLKGTNPGTYQGVYELNQPGGVGLGGGVAARLMGATTDLVAFGNAVELQLNTGSIECWFRYGSFGYVTNQDLFSKLGAWRLGTDGSNRSNGLSIVEWSLADRYWHHMVMTFEGGVAGASSLYIDGVLRATGGVTIANQTGTLRAGRFNGDLQYLALYSAKLSAADVTENYFKGIERDAEPFELPYGPTSYVRRKLAASTPLDTTSNDVVRNLAAQVAGFGAWINYDSYSQAHYVVPPNQPLQQVGLHHPSYFDPELIAEWKGVPIPGGATEAPGSDKHMVVWQPSSGKAWEFWVMHNLAYVPNAPGTTTATTGGTLAAGTYYYVTTAVTAAGETTASAQATRVTTGATSTVTVTIGTKLEVTSFNIYRSTVSGSGYQLIGSVTNPYTDEGDWTSAVAFIDDGSATPGVAPPTTNTATLASWVAEWGGMQHDTYNNPGYFYPKTSWGGTATSLPRQAQAITIAEAEADGRTAPIRHALGLLSRDARSNPQFVWPAFRGDGVSASPTPIEGMIFRLPARYDPSAMPNPLGRRIAAAVRDYGMCLHDKTASTGAVMVVERRAYGGPDPWIGTGGLFEGSTPDAVLAEFPWGDLQVVSSEAMRTDQVVYRNQRRNISRSRRPLVQGETRYWRRAGRP